ncbi:hypothetical protein N825_08815 [Skermanella stibiiresistens SB22]|uniref:Major facilitator superfamily (MFS) profile domain-containing protein n=1 Tax=Skermanella stibiiresistens SB22 TaxID=1385369 RepID=W9GYT1_9PROT|nr:MFS transporter [Skermanella stibiiresistens]EWY39095.1 hypothetical protein N825_08815 [Skermanella stibiiresistens SB22]
MSSPPRLPVVLATVTLVQALGTMGMLSFSVIAPSAARSLGVGAELVGFQISLAYVAATLCSAPSGTVVRRWGAVRVSQAALLFCGAGTAVAATGHLALAAVGSILIGVGYGLTNPSASHLLFRFTPPHRRNLVFSIKQTGVPLGGIAAGLLLPRVTEASGWPVALLTVSVAAVALAVALSLVRPRWDADRQPGLELRADMTEGPRMVWREKPLRFLSVTAFCFSGLQLCLVTFLVTLLVTELGYSLIFAGTVAAVAQAAGAVGRIVWGWIADRLNNALAVLIMVAITSGLACGFTAVVDPSWPIPLVLVLFVGFGLSAIGWNGVFLAEVARLAPLGTVGTATGGALAFTFAGVALGPTVFAGLYTVVGSYTTMFIFPGLMMLVSLGLLQAARVEAAARR